MKARVFAAVYWVIVVATSAIFSTTGLIAWLISLPVNRLGAWPHANALLWGRLLVWLNPAWRIAVTGREQVGAGPYVVVCNHQSQTDILSLCFLPLHFKWISKASVFRIPLMGWSMRACGYIAIERGEKDSIAKCMQVAASWIRRGVSVAFFPEGTRSPDGTVRPFKLGAFRLAIETGAPILPVTLSGTEHVLPKGGWVFDSARIRLHVDAPISPPSDPAGAEAFAEQVRAQIVARKASLETPNHEKSELVN